MEKKKPFVMKPVILVASRDHVWLSEMQARLTRLDSIVLPAVWETEVREVIECHSDKLGLAIVDEDFRPLVPELTELRTIFPKLHIIGCAAREESRESLRQLGCTDAFPLVGRPLFERVTEIVTRLKTVNSN